MKEIKDYMDDLVNQLVQNQTLCRSQGGGLYIPENITKEEVVDAIFDRAVPFVNEVLAEKYGLGMVGKAVYTQETVDIILECFYDGIVADLSTQLTLNVSRVDSDDRFKKRIASKYVKFD